MAGQELLPDNLIGKIGEKTLPELGTGTEEEQDLAKKLRSTFKVVRSVADEECVGFFEGLTAWDKAVMSAGPAHWTLALKDRLGKSKAMGELPPLIGLLRLKDLPAYKAAFGRFGLDADRGWDSGTGLSNGAEVAVARERKYVDFYAVQTDDGTFEVPDARDMEGEWFRGWHWTYRFAMAARRIKSWREIFWIMTRTRIRDLRGAKLQIEYEPDENGDPTLNKTVSFGELLSSEAAQAFVHRFHIYSPAKIFGPAVAEGTLKPGNLIYDAIKRRHKQNRTINQDELLWEILQRHPQNAGITLKVPDKESNEHDIKSGQNAGWRAKDKVYWTAAWPLDRDNVRIKNIEARRVICWPYFRKFNLGGREGIRPKLKNNFRHFRIKPSHLFLNAASDDKRLLISNEMDSFDFYDSDLPAAWYEDEDNIIALDNLVTKLDEVGFKPLGPTATSELRRHPALREFQVAAAMPSLRHEESPLPIVTYLKVTNDRRYTGWIGLVKKHDVESPRVNSALAHLIRHWGSRRYRPPLLMERHPIDANGAPTNGDVKRNMWAADAELPPRTGIFARDMGDLIGPNDDSLQPVGVYDAAAKGVIARNRVVGPGLKENFCLPEAELKPFVLFGEQTIPDGEGATATRSTFRIVRAIGEALFGGYLDEISSSEKNGLRFAFWARRPNASATQDELGGFLAFLRYAAPGAGRRLLDSFGLMTEVRWEQIKGNKVDTTGLNRIRDHAHLSPATRLGFQAGERKFRGAWGIDEEKHFRAWHWAYRFQAMARTDPSFRLAVWDMIRMRLRELLYLSWLAFEVKGEIHWHPQEPLDEFAFLLQKTVGEGLYHRYVASAVADEVISEEGRRVSSLFDVGVIAQSMPYVTVDEERPDAFELVIFDRRKRELRVLASLTLPESGIENAADSSVEEKVQNWAYGVLRAYRWRDAGMVLQRNSTKVRFVTQIPYRTRLTDPGPSVAAGLNHADGTGFIPGTQTALRQRVGVLADSDNTIAPVAAWPVHPGNVISRDPTEAISPNNEKS